MAGHTSAHVVIQVILHTGNLFIAVTEFSTLRQAKWIHGLVTRTCKGCDLKTIWGATVEGEVACGGGCRRWSPEGKRAELKVDRLSFPPASLFSFLPSMSVYDFGVVMVSWRVLIVLCSRKEIDDDLGKIDDEDEGMVICRFDRVMERVGEMTDEEGKKMEEEDEDSLVS
ncbi:hypothetical protein R6Q59_023184 [Mikania micrantha]